MLNSVIMFLDVLIPVNKVGRNFLRSLVRNVS